MRCTDAGSGRIVTKVALLVHRGGNIGHDLMAVGVETAVREAFGGEVQIDFFEQHNHFEIYPANHWLRFMHRVPQGRFGFIRRWLNSDSMRHRLWQQASALDYDVAIACGGPNIVPGGSRTPELGLMLHHMNGAFHHRGVPLIDVAVGACFPMERGAQRLEDEADRRFYATALEFCRMITVRDVVARAVVRDLGFDPPLIPCAAIATGRVFERGHQLSGGHVVINFQRLGANTDWGQGVDPKAWLCTMQEVISDLGKRHALMILAHNEYERRLAGMLAPQLPCHLPKTTDEYADVISAAKVGIVSRIHAAIPLAGIGVPAVVVGTDTRLGTAVQVGLPTMFVNKATPEWIVDSVEALVASAAQEHERLISLREAAISQYAAIFRTHAKQGM